MKDLYAFAVARGIKFAYVQFPRKIDSGSRMIPQHLGLCHSHEVVDSFLENLTSCHVPNLDVRNVLDATPESVNRNFFRTDHHWNFDGAFAVFPTVARFLADCLGVRSAKLDSRLAPSAWKRQSLPRKFLGSLGRRVGKLFTEMDDIYYYVHEFETEITKEIPSEHISAAGAFERSVMEAKYIAEPKSWMGDHGYSIYGGDFDYVRYINGHAPVDKKLLISKDSYALPVIAWLTTVFSRVDVVDLRFLESLRQETLLDVAEVIRPDMIVLMHNPFALMEDKFWQFGKSD